MAGEEPTSSRNGGGLGKHPHEWAIAAALLLGIGSVGPWAEASVFGLTASKGGLSGDGVLTVLCAVVALISLLHLQQRESKGTVAIVFGVLATAVSIYDLIDVGNTASGVVHPGWGLYLAGVSSIALVVTSAMARNEAVRRQAAQAGEPSNAESAPTPSGEVGDSLDDIQRLADLHHAGVLSDNEFAAKKAAVLSRLTAPHDSADHLQKLADLHERGVLTTAEYEAKKAAVLSRS